MFNYKLAEIAHEIDKVNLNELTPIDALNTLVRIKEKMKQKKGKFSLFLFRFFIIYFKVLHLTFYYWYK